MQYVTNSIEETIKLASGFASILKPGDVVALIGELGVGKTEFVRGICMGLGCSNEIFSPSFVRVHQYKICNGDGQSEVLNPKVRCIYHADFYLAKSLDDALDYGLDELYGGENIVVIEWADRFPQVLPTEYWHISIEFSLLNENQRKISIYKTK